MKIADVSIRRPVFALMMSVALVTLGVFSYGSLGVDLMPRTEQPNVNVRVGLPGASNGPHLATYEPRPASSSSRFVAGDDQVNCRFRTSVRR